MKAALENWFGAGSRKMMESAGREDQMVKGVSWLVSGFCLLGTRQRERGLCFSKRAPGLRGSCQNGCGSKNPQSSQFGSRSSGSLFSKETLQRQFNREIEA